jgi:tetratricopeptide (TPR) repeat protein
VPVVRLQAFGVPVEIRADFVLMFGAFGLLRHGAIEPALVFLGMATLAVLVHEAGHAIGFSVSGDRPTVVLHAAGGETRGGHHGAARMVLITAAGPAAGLLLGLLVLLAGRVAPAEPAVRLALDDALFLTVGLSLINLVPIGHLDGNAILTGIVSIVTGRPAGLAGWLVGALSVLGLFVGSLMIGRYELAFFLVFIVIASSSGATAGLRLFGAPTDTKSAPGLLMLGRAEEALAVAGRTLRKRPSDVDTLLMFGTAQSALTRYAEAEAVYDAVLELVPEHLGARAGRFAARRALGRVEDAQADLDAVLARPPVIVQDVLTQALALYLDNQLDRGLALLHVVAARPSLTRPETLVLRGMMAAFEGVNGNPEAALDHAEALVAIRPDDHLPHETASLALTQLGRFDEAVDHAKRALVAAPRHPELLETLGIAERLSGRADTAVGRLTDAAIARPLLPRGRAELSICFTQLGRHAEAAAALDQLPAWTVDDPHVRYARACQLAAAGRMVDAAEQVVAAARIRPSLGLLAQFDPVLRSLAADDCATAVMAGIGGFGRREAGVDLPETLQPGAGAVAGAPAD